MGGEIVNRDFDRFAVFEGMQVLDHKRSIERGRVVEIYLLTLYAGEVL
jgi:hypothetical protein